MIDAKLLRQLGWSDELIKEAERIAEQLHDQESYVGDTEIDALASEYVETSTTITVSAETADLSVWPRFGR